MNLLNTQPSAGPLASKANLNNVSIPLVFYVSAGLCEYVSCCATANELIIYLRVLVLWFRCMLNFLGLIRICSKQCVIYYLLLTTLI